MIDADFKVYLIECNTNPCLELPCPLLTRVISQVLDNTFRVAVDPLFPPFDFELSSKRTAALPAETKYELVFDEEVDGPELRELFGDDTEMIDIQEAEEESSEDESLCPGEDELTELLQEDDE